MRDIQIYASWCKGLPQDDKAIKILTKSGAIDGVETRGIDAEFDLLKEKINVSLHNPKCMNLIGLDDANFIKTFSSNPSLAEHCEKSTPATMGFHAGYAAIDEKETSLFEMKSNIVSNIEKLQGLITKKVIFESSVYNEKFSKRINGEVLADSTGPAFLQYLLSKTSAGFLFDVAHNMVSGHTKIRNGFYMRSLEEYFDEIIEAVGDKTYQMHLNVPTGKLSSGIDDAHLVLRSNDAMSRKVLSLAKTVIDYAPNLAFITLEMGTGLAPQKHAEVMVKQAKRVKKALHIRRSRKANLI